ncbi:MAG: glycoside hydrolase family 88 protein [Chloroflexota bacterium]|nr:glycoside hydrolase family 88 protein [Chloroflexota bacterium]
MNLTKSGLIRLCVACLGSTVLVAALFGAVGLQAGDGTLEPGVSMIFWDGFEGDLGAWVELTRTLGNYAAITTSPVHSGSQAVALVLSDLSGAGYVALSRTLPVTTNVRVRGWVHDFGNDWSGAVEVDAPGSGQYSLLAIPPSYVYTDAYGLRFNTEWVARAGSRSPGWHAFDLLVTNAGTMARVDEQVVERPVPTNTTSPWVHEPHTLAGALRLVSPWTTGALVYDDVEVVAPPSTTDDLILAVKDDFLALYGDTDFSPLYPTLGQVTTTPCLPDMRSIAGTAMAFALDARTGGGSGGTARVPVSRQRAIQLISDTLAYGQWAYDDINTVGLYNCNSLTTYELALSAWMIWWDLPLELRAAVQARVVADAERYVNQPPRDGYVGDTRAEENAWTAKFLALAANMFPFEPRASAWETAARCFAFHSITNQPTTYCGHTTQTVHPDFTLDNHGLSPNPLYADSVFQELSGGALAYRAAGRTVPDEFVHNVAGLWNRHQQDIDWGRTYYYRVNSDWDSQGWHWMGGSVAAFLSLEPAAYVSGVPLVTPAEEREFLQTRWLINDGRVAVHTGPVAVITETSFSPGTPSYAWFLNANQVQDGYIWGYLYHHPELLEQTTLLTPTLYMPAIAQSYVPPSFNNWQPAFSPDGQQVVFVRQREGGYSDVFLMNADGSGLSNLTQTPDADEDTPIFSPDGSKIAFASDREGQWDIYLMDSDGTNVGPIISRVESDELGPTFSPDGDSLAFSSDRDMGNWDIYVAPITGGTWTRLTTDPDVERFPVFSADGETLVYRRKVDGNSEIYVMDVASLLSRRLTSSPGFDGYPALTPDGSGVVFASSRSGDFQLHSVNIGGTGALTLTSLSGYRAHTPRLSNDGRTLIYAAAPVAGAYDIYTASYHSPLETLASRGATDTLGLCDWTSGVFAVGWGIAWRSTGDDAHAQRTQDWVDSCSIATYTITHVNDGLLGYASLMAYQFDPQPDYLVFAQRVADYLTNTAQRTSDGTLTHVDDTVWDDTMISVVPFLIEMWQVTGDHLYLDEAATQVVQHAAILQDPATGLYRHAWRESTDEYLSPSYWARGNSWNMIASAQLLDVLPITHTLRPQIVAVAQSQAQPLVAQQDSSGLWRTVVDRPDFYLESSGSAGIAYGLLCGVQGGWLPPDMAESAGAARLGLWRKVSADGTLTDVSAPTGPMVPEESYNAVLHDDMQLYGQGMGLLALSPCLH